MLNTQQKLPRIAVLKKKKDENGDSDWFPSLSQTLLMRAAWGSGECIWPWYRSLQHSAIWCQPNYCFWVLLTTETTPRSFPPPQNRYTLHIIMQVFPTRSSDQNQILAETTFNTRFGCVHPGSSAPSTGVRVTHVGGRLSTPLKHSIPIGIHHKYKIDFHSRNAVKQARAPTSFLQLEWKNVCVV